MIAIEVTAGCGHDVEVDIPPCDDCNRSQEADGQLCEEHNHIIIEVQENECGDCYRRNHPSLTAWERNQ